MKAAFVSAAAIAIATAAVPAAASAQHPHLHVNPRWKECSFQLDAALTQGAWRQFTREAGQVVYFRPLTGARPMGRGHFEVSVNQWQTNIDDHDAAWNDTFVHPDSTHWLYEGSGLKFPGLSLRAGVGERTDVGVYFTKNPNANYGVYAVQVQRSAREGSGRPVDLAVRGSFMSLFGPEDVDLSVLGVDLVASARPRTFARATVVPYATVATWFAASHENSPVVTLRDERALGVMGTVGAEFRFSVLRVAAEGAFGPVPSMSMKVGFGR